MERDDFKDNLDERLRVFFKAPEIEGSESFVFKVMEKIERREAFSLASFVRWLVPTFLLMAAALFLISLWPMAGEEAMALESGLGKTGPLAAQALAQAPAAERDWAGMEAL